MRYVVGVDAGGSNSRALVLNQEGVICGYAQSGGANPIHDSAFEQNLRTAIQGATKACGIENVIRLVAGIAGLNCPSDVEWAQKGTAPEGLTAPRAHVNDTEVAQYAAHNGAPGLISVQGTGSNVFGRLESGAMLRNWTFGHYARGGSPYIGMQAAFAILTEPTTPEDEEFRLEVLNFWEAPDPAAFYNLGARSWGMPHEEFQRKFGQMAPLVTHAAERGSPLARAVCNESARQIGQGIALVAQSFTSPEVATTLIGSVVRSPYMTAAVEILLSRIAPQCRLVEPMYAPVVGAALMALEEDGLKPTPEAREALKAFDPSVPGLAVSK